MGLVSLCNATAGPFSSDHGAKTRLVVPRASAVSMHEERKSRQGASEPQHVRHTAALKAWAPRDRRACRVLEPRFGGHGRPPRKKGHLRSLTGRRRPTRASRELGAPEVLRAANGLGPHSPSSRQRARRSPDCQAEPRHRAACPPGEGAKDHACSSPRSSYHKISGLTLASPASPRVGYVRTPAYC